MNELEQLSAWAGAFLAKLEPAARRALLRAVATELRRRQAGRIAAQRNPDGSPYEPRKPQLRQRQGRVRRSMFMRLRTARFLKTELDASTAAVTFIANAQRIAQVHHFGLHDRVNKAGLRVRYASRELLGFDAADIQCIADVLLSHLAK